MKSEELILSHLPIAKYAARYYTKRVPSLRNAWDDLYQVGAEAIVKAAKYWKSGGSTKFSTYAYTGVFRALRRHLGLDGHLKDYAEHAARYVYLDGPGRLEDPADYREWLETHHELYCDSPAEERVLLRQVSEHLEALRFPRKNYHGPDRAANASVDHFIEQVMYDVSNCEQARRLGVSENAVRHKVKWVRKELKEAFGGC